MILTFSRRSLFGLTLALLGGRSLIKNQINFPLPSGVMAPKLRLFDRVTVVENSFGERGQVFTITGLSYADTNVAVMEDLEAGWQYDLSVVYGVDDAAKLRKLDASPIVIFENYLIRV